MAKLETTDEFVLKLHDIVGAKGQIMIKDEFPELFGVKLEVGKWYIGTAVFNSFMKIIEVKSNSWGNSVRYYGFTHSNPFGTGEINNTEHEKSLRLATPEEIESMLLKEAEKRGYKAGLEVKDAFVHSKTYTIRNGVFLHTEVDGKFSLIDYASDSGNYIFYDGKWAEIVVDPNKEIKESIQRLEAELAELKSKVK